MSRKLELIREEKLFRLLPGRTKRSRLEASGVALVDDHTALVVFDNLNQTTNGGRNRFMDEWFPESPFGS